MPTFAPAQTGEQVPSDSIATSQNAAPQVAQTRFGPLPVSGHQVWLSASPMPGFEGLQRYALIVVEKQQPFLWLQSLDDAAVSFLLAPAAHFGLRYARLDAASVPMVMVLLPGQPAQPLRAHGQAPLVFDAQAGQFEQHIVEADEVEGDGAFVPQAAAALPADLLQRLLVLTPAGA